MRRRRGRVVLWGALRSDWQLGGDYDHRFFAPPQGGTKIALSNSLWPGLVGAVDLLLRNQRTGDVYEVDYIYPGELEVHVA